MEWKTTLQQNMLCNISRSTPAELKTMFKFSKSGRRPYFKMNQIGKTQNNVQKMEDELNVWKMTLIKVEQIRIQSFDANSAQLSMSLAQLSPSLFSIYCCKTNPSQA
jgi:5-bromo-4-chloroindolyl phosphate hydrolysis protein